MRDGIIMGEMGLFVSLYSFVGQPRDGDFFLECGADWSCFRVEMNGKFISSGGL